MKNLGIHIIKHRRRRSHHFAFCILHFALLVVLGASPALGQSIQQPLTPFYWIIGTVADAGAVKADGRTVVFYKDDATYAENNAQAVISGNQFIFNAFDIYPLDLAVGETYKLGIVASSDGYGLYPVNVVISGLGFEDVAAAGGVALNLELGGGLAGGQPGGTPGGTTEVIVEPAPAIIEPTPKISLWFGNRLYQKDLVARGDKFIIAPKPEIKVDISVDAPFTLSKNIGEYSIILDPGTPAAKTFTFTAQNLAQKVLAQAAEEQIQAYTLRYTLTEDLADGPHTLSFLARTSGTLGTAAIGTETATVEVLGGPLRLVGAPLVYPSPFSITKQKSAVIQYTLSANANIDIYLVGIGGARKKFFCEAGGEGGSAGLNKVPWDGRLDSGELAGNAIYIGTIIAREDGRLLGKVKLTIVD